MSTRLQTDHFPPEMSLRSNNSLAASYGQGETRRNLQMDSSTLRCSQRAHGTRAELDDHEQTTDSSRGRGSGGSAEVATPPLDSENDFCKLLITLYSLETNTNSRRAKHCNDLFRY